MYTTEQAVLLVCRDDGSYVVMKMDKREKDDFVGDVTAQSQWRELRSVKNAKYIGVSWMQVRRAQS